MDVTEVIWNHLDASATKDERINKILDLLHLLNFEKRLAELTEAEAEAMVNAEHVEMFDERRKKLDVCKSDAQRDLLINEWAKQQYFIQCAWSDYLNGVSDYKPFCSRREAERVMHILKT